MSVYAFIFDVALFGASFVLIQKIGLALLFITLFTRLFYVVCGVDEDTKRNDDRFRETDEELAGLHDNSNQVKQEERENDEDYSRS